MKADKRIRYYESFEDDFYENKDAPAALPAGYKWVRTDLPFKILSAFIYAAAIVFSSVYCRVFLHVKIVGGKKISKLKSGVFLYGNHTQPVGDVFDPALAVFPKRIYSIASPANLKLPVIGRLLPYLGALPLSSTLGGIKELNKAIELRIKQKCCIVIYPEAHVWDYCTFIRPFPDSSFKFPIKYGKPVFCATSTYKKSKFFKKPKITIYIDGPFEYDKTENIKKASEKLRDDVFAQMEKRSRESDFQYIEYKKKHT